MGYPRDDDKLFPIAHRVDNAVVTDANPEVVTSGKLYGARRSRVDCQSVDRRLDAFGDGTAEAAVGLDRLRMKVDLVVRARC